jgi:hypothetical protein
MPATRGWGASIDFRAQVLLAEARANRTHLGGSWPPLQSSSPVSVRSLMRKGAWAPDVPDAMASLRTGHFAFHAEQSRRNDDDPEVWSGPKPVVAS